jgi:glycogen debranching enzyme
MTTPNETRDSFLNQLGPHVSKAYDMAVKTLKNRYSDLGILAGNGHFSDLWARDFAFAGWGALQIGDYDVVRNGLETLISHMGPDGQVPLRVGQPIFILKYLGFDATPPKPRYKEDKGMSISIDNNALLVILAEQYVSISNDHAFLEKNIDSLKQILAWNYLQDQDDDNLIEEGHYAGWADSLKKHGNVLYTNVLHYQATRVYAQLVRRLGRDEESEYYHNLADKISDAINIHFWNGHYYIDWISGKERQETFSTDGNLLAILYGVASTERVKRIQRCLVEFQLDKGYTTGTNYPKYRPRHIYFPFFLINMQDYHNGLEWLWLGCLDIVCKWQHGQKREALEHLSALSEKIVTYGGVYEVYDQGIPVKRLFYRSEEFFAWSSGMFLWMVGLLQTVSDNDFEPEKPEFTARK